MGRFGVVVCVWLGSIVLSYHVRLGLFPVHLKHVAHHLSKWCADNFESHLLFFAPVINGNGVVIYAHLLAKGENVTADVSVSVTAHKGVVEGERLVLVTKI